MATYVNDLRLKEIATGDESGTWGTSTNTNLELIAEAFSFGTEAITTNADTHTTTIADGSTDPGRSIYLKYTGTLDSACTITIGPNTVSKLWFIENGTSGSQNIIISQGSGANVTVPAGEVKAIYSDGAGSGAAMVDAFANLKVSDAAQTNITSLGTLTTLTVDDITINGSTISSTPNLILDVEGNIILDANGSEVILRDGGSNFAFFQQVSDDLEITSTRSDADIKFKGNDGGSFVTALAFDMSAAGAATFNDAVALKNTLSISSSNTSAFLQASDNILQFGTSSDDPVTFFANNAERMRIDSSGNVGIGTTSPDNPLHIASTTPVICLEETDASQEFEIGSYGGAFAIRDKTDNAFRVVLDGSGNVGIGTTSPDSPLEIDGGSSSNTVLHLTSTTANTFLKISDSNTNEGNFIGCTTNDLTLFTRNSERMRIDSNGLLMVGTTATNTHESSGAGNEGVVIRPAGFSAWSVSNEICQILNRKTSNGVIMQFNFNGSSVGTISTNANSLPSDRNFKRDIEDLNIGLDLVTKLNPVSYNYKIDNEGTPKMFGLIAQDLEESLKEVGVDKNSVQLLQHEPNDDEKQSDYSLDYLKFTPILIKAIQEQQEQIDALQSEINILKGE